MVAKVDERNAKYCRKGEGGVDIRRNTPKKRTRFPGQCIYCGVCGRMFVFGGHGQKDHLMCNGAREHACWNGVAVDGPRAAEKIAAAFLREVEGLADFDATFLALVTEESRKLDSTRKTQLEELTRTREKRTRKIQNLIKFIREGGSSPSIHTELCTLEDEQKRLEREIKEWEDKPTNSLTLPSLDELRQLARDAIWGLAIESYDFAKVMRELVGKITVRPYQPIDGGKIVLRATFTLLLAKLIPDPRAREVLGPLLEKTLTIDLFDPPQRVAYRERVVALRKESTEREVSQALGITVAAGQRTAALDRMMQARGLGDPYRPVTEPPANIAKLRRHRHPRV